MDEADGQVLVCIELITPVHLRSPIVMRVETDDQTAIGRFTITCMSMYNTLVELCVL